MTDLRAIAFYLPQFHPIPENDAWWGKGFTEWTNVAKAEPVFRGHLQPNLPADLGFYDLRLPEVRALQAELAREAGIAGFCYYHYWFNGRRLLDRPFREVLESGKPDFPFCLCWANENWSRRWDGQDQEVLMAQNYSSSDDLAHIESLLPAFRDERYIRVNGRPLFLIWRVSLLPDAARTASVWRDAARRAGLGDLYLASVDSITARCDPREIGFDAAVEFAPDLFCLPSQIRSQGLINRARRKFSLLPATLRNNYIAPYFGLVDKMLEKPEPPYKRFRCVTPRWDNSPRRKTNALIFYGSTPDIYQEWLAKVVQQTLAHFEGEERLVFINAWNEWAEGSYLEPDQRSGHAYLEATRKALQANMAISSDLHLAANSCIE